MLAFASCAAIYRIVTEGMSPVIIQTAFVGGVFGIVSGAVCGPVVGLMRYALSIEDARRRRITTAVIINLVVLCFGVMGISLVIYYAASYR